MSYQTLESSPRTARQRLVESSGTPFAPSSDVRPVVRVLDGQRTNADLEPVDWIDALEAADGTVAVYFRLAADHEWWLAYEPDRDGEDDLDGPFHRWTTYPSGGWTHRTVSRGVLTWNLEDVYGEHDRDRECEVYRSRVVCLEDAPEFVRSEVSGRDD